MRSKGNFLSPQKLAILITLSAIGGVASVIIGYAAKGLSFIPIGAPVAGQFLAGLHILWLVLVAAIVRVPGAATAAGALKGTIEMFLPNHLGPFVFLISFLEGFIVEIAFWMLGKFGRLPVLVICGFSATSNVFVLQTFELLPAVLPFTMYVGMYVASFVSGLIFGGYLGMKTLNRLHKLLQTSLPALS